MSTRRSIEAAAKPAAKKAANGRTSKAAPKVAAAQKAPAKRASTKAAPKVEAVEAKPFGGRQPVTPDAEIVAWAKGEAAQLRKAEERVTAAGLLRAWRAQGGEANPRRFAALVAGIVG